MDHLAEAKRLTARAGQRDGMEEDYFSAQLAIAHVLISIRERMEQDANLALVSQVDQDAVEWHDINDNLL